MKWQPHDIVILILAITISAALLLTFVRPFIDGAEVVVMSENGAKLAASLLMSLVAVVSMYIVSKSKNK